ncbi:MAG: SRPBCC family protein [Pseudomonadota bacterium]
MKIHRSKSINAPVEDVWRVLADHYADVGKRARAVESSSPNENAPTVNGSEVGGRVCQTSIGPATEILTHFDAANHHLKYKAHAEKMPFFVRALYGDWKLSSLGETTKVDFGFEADLSFPFSILMPPLKKIQFKKPIEETLDDLKTLMETGRTHPDKGETELDAILNFAGRARPN